MHFSTCDLCDSHETQLADGRLQIVEPGYLALGQRTRFAGPAMTLKLFEDNSLVREQLEQPGEGRVLVIDGGGSRRCALVGGNLAALADQHAWAGILVYGCVRDVTELQQAQVGVRALGLHPRKSFKRGEGEADITLHFSGVRVRRGNWVYADEDGILIADAALS